MTATSAAVRGRAAAERLMADACTITDGAAEQVYDAGSDSYTTPAGSTRHAGACKIRPRDNADRVVEAAGQTVSLWPYIVSVPMSVTTVELNDVVTVTACQLDPSLVGTVLRVRQVLQGSYVTARRLGCEVQSD